MTIGASFYNGFIHQQLMEEFAPGLPASMRLRLNGFRNERDAQLYLLGRLLVIRLAQHCGYAAISLDDMEVDAHQRPFFAGGPYFNITHAGDYVVCAVSGAIRHGIDIELVKPLDIEDFKSVFCRAELDAIGTAADSLRTLYWLWTRKEAAIKANGKGLQIPPDGFDVLGNCVTIEGQVWHLQELALDSRYVAHLATDQVVDRQPEILTVAFDVKV
jgi:4'-phosphopantetheinyl transferase